MSDFDAQGLIRAIQWSVKANLGTRDWVYDTDGVHGVEYQMPYLQATVGRTYLRKVQIYYDAGRDLFNIVFGKIHRRTYDWTVCDRIEGVQIGDLNQVLIDRYNAVTW